MESVIKEQLEVEDSRDEHDLVLSDWKGESIREEEKKLLEEFTELEFISFRGCGLSSLKNFPRLPALKKLDLGENSLVGPFDVLRGLPGLIEICLDNNEVTSLEALEPFRTLADLISLDLENNPLADEENYREQVFKMFPNLEALDRIDQEGNEVFDSEDLDEEDDDFESEEDFQPQKRGGPESAEAPTKRKKPGDSC